MYNSNESKMIGSCTGKGAIVGGIICAVMFVWSLLGGIWNELCNCIGTRNCNLPTASNFLIYLFAFLIPTLIGLLVGLAQASSARNARLEQEKAAQYRSDLQQRQAYARSLKQKSQALVQEMQNIQNSVKSISEKPPLSSTQKQEKGWEAINDAFNVNTELKYQADALGKEAQ